MANLFNGFTAGINQYSIIFKLNVKCTKEIMALKLDKENKFLGGYVLK